MFNNMGVHVIDNPNGRYSFVGSVPHVLGESVPATREDIMAGRTYTTPTGETMTTKFPSFASRAEAIKYAADKGITVRGNR